MRRFLLLAIVVWVVLALALAGAARPAGAQSYGPDVTSTGYAISGGDSGANAKTYAFDNDTSVTNHWDSLQATGAVPGAAYIGQDFGAGNEKHVRRITVKQNNAAGSAITSARVEAGDCATWNTVTTITLVIDISVQEFALSASQTARCWRLLALTAPTSSNWRVYEIEMMEAVSWPTDTPGPSATPTITLTPSTTPSPTPNYYVEVTSATLGAPMRFERSATAGDLVVAVTLWLIGGLGFTVFAIWFWQRRPDGS